MFSVSMCKMSAKNVFSIDSKTQQVVIFWGFERSYITSMDDFSVWIRSKREGCMLFFASGTPSCVFCQRLPLSVFFFAPVPRREVCSANGWWETHTPKKKQVLRSSGLEFSHFHQRSYPKNQLGPSNGGVNDSVLRRVSGISKPPVLRSHDS